MPDFTTDNSTGFITDTFTTREESNAPEDAPAEEAASPPEDDATHPVTLETPVSGDPEEMRRRLMADYTIKTQQAADERRRLEALDAELQARQRVLEQEREALNPYRQFDALVAQDPALADVVRSRVGQIEPGKAQNFSDTAAARMAQMENAMQQMVVSNAEQFLMSKYPDYAANRPLVQEQMRRLGLSYPGHDVVRVTQQMEAAYELATRGRTVHQARQDAERSAVQKVAATRVGAGTASGGPAPEPDIPMRRPDGRMIPYSDLGEMLKSTMPRR